MASCIRIRISASTNSGHRRGWFKHVTSVDTTKKNGYAFNGSFLRDGENDLPIGSIIVEQYPTGSVKNGVNKGIAYTVQESGLVQFASCENFHRNFLSFRDTIADSLVPVTKEIQGINQEELLRERAQLKARLQEIDALLKNYTGETVYVS
jgi:hypothetical protein